VQRNFLELIIFSLRKFQNGCCSNNRATALPVGLGSALDLILLLDGVAVLVVVGSVDELISEALSNRLQVAESGRAGTLGHQVDGRVDAAEGRDIDGLATDDTSRTDTGGILAGASLHDGIGDNLHGVLAGQEVDELESVLDDLDREPGW
jgi:hypothetical protein